MSWSNNRPGSHPRYQSKQHRTDVARAKADLTAAGSGYCAETVCLMRSRYIAPGMDLHLCHERTTGRVLGLGHAACNRSEAGRYARALQNRPRTRDWWG